MIEYNKIKFVEGYTEISILRPYLIQINFKLERFILEEVVMLWILYWVALIMLNQSLELKKMWPFLGQLNIIAPRPVTPGPIVSSLVYSSMAQFLALNKVPNGRVTYGFIGDSTDNDFFILFWVGFGLYLQPFSYFYQNLKEEINWEFENLMGFCSQSSPTLKRFERSIYPSKY